MHLPKRGVAVIGSALMAVAVLSSAPASAASHTVRPAANQVCQSSQLCLYQNKDLNANGGSYWAFGYNGYAHDQWIYVGDGGNDQTTSFINYRQISSAVAKNEFDISRATCARIVGDAGHITEFIDYNLSDNVWPDRTKMNDTISAFMLMSTEWNLDCGEVFSYPSG
jgi:hypothetical protein